MHSLTIGNRWSKTTEVYSDRPLAHYLDSKRLQGRFD